MNALKNNPSENVAASGRQTQTSTLRRANGWQRACVWLAAFAVMLGALGVSHAQTIRRITAPGKFYVDDKQGAGIVYNYAVYMVSNNTASTIPSAYVALTNLIATNLISLSTNDSGVRPLGALAPGETKMAAFFLKGPSFTANSDSLYNTTNETHTIRVYNGVPGIGTALVSSNYAFTNIIYMIEALANKITIITNLNPLAPLGTDVDLVIGGDTGTIGGDNSLFFSPAVLGSWRPDSYELKETIVRFTENPTFTNRLFFDPSVTGFTNFSGQLYTNTFRFRAIKVTSTNIPVSPFAFIDSGSGTKHTSVSSLASAGGGSVFITVSNRVIITSQTVTPSSLLAPGGTVTYSITFSNAANTVDLSEIRNALPGFPGNATYIPGSATYNALPIANPSISGQNLLWALPFTVISNSTATLTFQATIPLAFGLYTNSVTAILGAEQIDTTFLTTDNLPSRSVLTVLPVSDMGVGKTGPASIFASSNFTYTISVTNFGPSPNSSFTVTDSLPASVTFVSATPPAITNGNLVIWTNLGTFAANASSNLFLTVRAPANAAGLTNTATVGGPISDPNSTNNVTPPVITTSVTNRPPVAVNDTTPAVNGVAQVFNPLTNDSDPDGDTFIIQSVSFPGGTVSINSGSTNITFTVTNNSNGSISYTIVDTRGGTSTAVISITGLNTAPVANSQSIGINEDTATNLVLTATDDGTNYFTILSGPANGALTGFNGTSGAVTYTPATNYIGADSFTFRVNDGFLSSTGTVSITVSPINDPPIANNQTFTMPEDTSTNVVLTASDVDSTNLVFAILVGPTNGTLGVLNPNTGVVSFTPNTNFAGNDGFTFTVFDGQHYATGNVFSITINPLNDAPVAINQSVGTPEDTLLNVVVSATDVDSTNLVFAILTSPLNGTLGALNPTSGAITYLPTTNYVGPDVFTFTVTDGLLSSTGSVFITVGGVNDNPLIVPDIATVNEDSVSNIINVLVNDFDIDGDPLSIISVVTTNGTAFISGSNVVYTPSPDFFGTNVMTYCATDGDLTNCATITVTVLPINDAPLANNQSVNATEDTALPITLTGSDVDGPVSNFVVGTLPANGTLTGSGANLTYTPNTNYTGSDSFTFTVNDGSLTSLVATVSITVNAVNDGPLANSQSVSTSEDIALPITLTGSDVDGPVSNFVLGTLPANGTLSGSGANLTYTPNTNYTGSDSFTFTINDGSLTSAVATVSITVNAVNDAPLANSQSVSTAEDTALPITLTGSDVDGPVSNFVVGTGPANGTLSGSGANLTYTPNTNYNGSDSFTFTINDGSLTSAVATVSITVNAINDPPVIVPDIIIVTEDSTNTIPVLVNDSDPDGDPLTPVTVTTTNGTAVISGTNVVYTPSTNFVGTNVMTYCATDGLVTNCASITVIVTPVNDAPLANNQSVNTAEDTALPITLTGSDVDGPVSNFVVGTSPANGTLSGSGANLTYTPNTNFNGADSFTFTINDGSLTSAVATVSITVTPINDVPVAANDSYSFTKNITFNEPAAGVLANDTDVEGPLSTVLVTTTTNGLLTLNANGSFQYTPSTNFVGVDTFTYRASDGTTNSGIATVTLNVLATNSAPVAVADFYNIAEDTQLVVPVSGVLTNDTDVDATPLTAVLVATTTNGTLNLLGNGSFTYTPSTNFVGVDTFTYRADDGSLVSGITTVTITVGAVNDSPVAINQSVTTPEDTSTNLVLTASDVDSSNLVFAVLSGPSNGSLGTLNTNTGAVTYSPSNNFNGADNFTFTVTDGSLLSTGTVSIIVTPINDPPVIIPDIITVTEDSTNTIPVLVNDTDPDGNPLTITSVTTTNGTAVISGTNVVYTPSTNFFGTNVMTYCATDGLVTNCATITVIVTPVNDGPLANSQSVSTSEDIALPITLTGSDVDGPVMNFVVGTGPSNGTLSGTGANITYTPGLNYNGSDSFTFRVNDGSLTSAVATVSITVNAVNDGPVVVNDIITVTEDSTNTIPVLINDSDPDGNPLTITSVSTTNGNATVVGTNVVYTPSLNFNGTNTLTYCATDGLITNCASITVIVTPVNDGPLANNQNVGTPEDNLLNVVVTGSDIDSANLVFAILTAPVNGTLGTINPNSGAVTYLPSTNYVGPDMFTFTVSDGSLLSTGTVSITVGGVNDNPLIVPDIATVNEDSVNNIISVLVNDFDIDGDPISLVSVNTTNGTAVIVGTNVVYTPSANFNGTNVMTYCATDGDMTNCATITVTVLPINDAPVAINQNVSTPEDTLRNVVVSGSDIDSAILTYAILTGPANGSLGVLNTSSGAVAYTPSANYNGADSFTFTVSDGSLLSTGTVSITVSPVNDAPIANNDSFTAQQNITTVFTPSGVLANDTDVENNPLTAVLVSPPANGVVALNSNGGFVYTSTNNFIGTDTFTYRANDGTSNSAPATVSILVTPLADVVVTKSGPTNVNPSQTFTYTINVANAGPSSASNVVVIDTLPVNLTFVSASAGGVNSSGTVTWPTLASLAVNASTNFTVTVTAPTNGSFVNIASASATTEDLNLSNNNGSASGSRVQTDVVPIPFGIRIGTNVFNPQTGLFEQTVIVTNTGNATASAIRLLAWNFTTLTNGAPRTNVWLWNYHGVANDGRRYVQYNGGVNPGAWVTFHLEYYAPTRVPFTNSLEAQVTLPVPATTNLSGGVLIDVAFADNRPSDPRFVIEWASIIGRNYTVIYSDSLTGPWTAATPTVTATATRTQWYDDGPPKTASEPLIGSRYYRVILNPINN